MTDTIQYISEAQVMKSAAGFYIGQSCQVDYGDYVATEPYSRLSQQYYATAEEAQDALDNDTYDYRGWV